MNFDIAAYDPASPSSNGIYWVWYSPNLPLDTLNNFYYEKLRNQIPRSPNEIRSEQVVGKAIAVNDTWCCWFRVCNGGRDGHGRPGRFVILCAFARFEDLAKNTDFNGILESNLFRNFAARVPAIPVEKPVSYQVDFSGVPSDHDTLADLRSKPKPAPLPAQPPVQRRDFNDGDWSNKGGWSGTDTPSHQTGQQDSNRLPPPPRTPQADSKLVFYRNLAKYVVGIGIGYCFGMLSTFAYYQLKPKNDPQPIIGTKPEPIVDVLHNPALPVNNEWAIVSIELQLRPVDLNAVAQTEDAETAFYMAAKSNDMKLTLQRLHPESSISFDAKKDSAVKEPFPVPRPGMDEIHLRIFQPLPDQTGMNYKGKIDVGFLKSTMTSPADATNIAKEMARSMNDYLSKHDPRWQIQD